MQGSRPRRLRFVVGSVLLVGAPLMTGCPEDEPPIVNTPPLPPNPVGTEPPQTPTMEGVGVPLPTPNTVATPEPPVPPTVNTYVQPEVVDEAVEEMIQANPSLLDPAADAPPTRVIRANPGPAEREPIGQ